VHTLHAHKTQTQTTTTTTARFCIHAAAPQQAQRRLVHVDALELDEYMPTGQAARKRNAITSLLARQPASQPDARTHESRRLTTRRNIPRHTPKLMAQQSAPQTNTPPLHCSMTARPRTLLHSSLNQHSRRQAATQPASQPAHLARARVSVCLPAWL
jgi:hypothetical protein